MYSVILAGGGGTRLQPISTEEKPKQFLTLINQNSLLQNTVERILQIDSDPQHIFISTGTQYREQSLDQLANYHVDKIITEPERRNTAPAIAYIIKYLEDVEKIQSDSIILVCPSDHHIAPVEKYASCIQEGMQYAQEGEIVLFGIKPNAPETGYGYIKIRRQDFQRSPTSFLSLGKVDDLGISAMPIQQFVEKPDSQKAQEYLDAGNYYRNGGIFLFRIDTMKEEFKTFAPEIYEHMSLPFDEFVATFSELPKISIDYAVMEKTKKSILIPMDLEWSDLGNRDALWKYGSKDDQGHLLVEGKKISYPNIIVE